MSLISVANLQSYCDKLGAIWALLKPVAGISSGSPVAGTLRNLAANALRILTHDTDDYEQQTDLSDSMFTAMGQSTVEAMSRILAPVISELNGHLSERGDSVHEDITDLFTFLNYYNGGAGGAKFSSMLTPDFGDLYFAMTSRRLPPAGVLSPGIHPALNSAYVNGMGQRAVGGGFVAGDAVDTSLYSEVVPLVEVITNFANGSVPPSVTISGIDDTGAATTTWSTSGFGDNNPTAAVSTTITPAVAAQSRQTVEVDNANGIVAGSVLTVNAGQKDEEVIVVEAVSGADLTAVFQKAHNAGASLSGFRTFATTPSVEGRRCRSVTGITINSVGHTAGTVRVVGRQDRVGKPD